MNIMRRDALYASMGLSISITWQLATRTGHTGTLRKHHKSTPV
ncbi:uncharacterized protein RAG0_06711 [Rhynchosporium agropyri]|uniref:Uncharacterized protein n=2 Tax=Rhynchosporium TaxID=38037 RepID=A0A1E1KIB5_9HELO|nr:uncharacterized protein RAG0_06711 [Rhynchosporium agropyri]CZT11433.1 uncharacterized protein RCO7_15138 [Rhynchosporium commune]